MSDRTYGSMHLLTWAMGQTDLPPAEKLALIGFAEYNDIIKVATFVGVSVEAACDLTRNLIDAGRLTPELIPAAAPPPPGPTRFERRKLPERIRQQVLDRDDRRCQRCGSTDDPCVDHIVPQSKGGGDELENLQILCRPCNTSKGAR